MLDGALQCGFFGPGAGRSGSGNVAGDPLMQTRCYWDIGVRTTAIWVARSSSRARDSRSGLLRGRPVAAFVPPQLAAVE